MADPLLSDSPEVRTGPARLYREFIDRELRGPRPGRKSVPFPGP